MTGQSLLWEMDFAVGPKNQQVAMDLAFLLTGIALTIKTKNITAMCL